ncbi:hypothetical protein C1J03_14425 [Sulfitobacter sp. SK012]|uniref:hypothetical protein n=1 Tax=Sulfitobacter sp. SK012 TaxID=1389005 RepID=UPI000E0C8547|nr:hypothetical protein [Sulfitobacter sp. SK012]AXI47107.1 hypothetical protein C1J03_14425 [Sulfitobacter sp. SK012]
MQLVLHTGVHFTEEERLLKCLLRNAEDLGNRGVAVPGPGKYRSLVRDTLNAMTNSPAAPGAREVLLDSFLDEGEAERVILSDGNFFRTPSTAVQGGMLYPAAPVRMMRMMQLFPSDQFEIFMAIRNPATLLPVLYEKSQNKDGDAFWGGRDPRQILWSETIALIREAAPEATLTVWCNEDAPLIWAEIIREMAGLDHGEKIIGGFDLLTSIMSAEGMTRFRGYLKDHPVMTEIQKRRVIAAFLGKYGLDDQIEEELDMPGWTDALVEEMSDIYDDDLVTIQRIPGVTVLSP